jgi:hypothetical protein
MINQTQIFFYELIKLSDHVRNNILGILLNRVFSTLTQYNILSQNLKSKSLELIDKVIYSRINRTNQLSLVNFSN